MKEMHRFDLIQFLREAERRKIRLLAMKKFTQRDPLKQARNLEDIRYLQSLKAKRHRRKSIVE